MNKCLSAIISGGRARLSLKTAATLSFATCAAIASAQLASNCWPRFQNTNASTSLGVGYGAGGSVKWTEPLLSYSFTSPTVAPDGTVYVTDTQQLYAFDSQGNTKWTKASCGQPAIGANGTIYFAYGNGISAMDPTTQSILWSYSGASGPTPIVGQDGSIYDFEYDIVPAVVGLNSDGSLKWKTSFSYGGEGDVFFQTAILSQGPDGKIYVGSINGLMFALDPSNGGIVWTCDTLPANSTSNNYMTAAAVGGNGLVYFGGDTTGEVYAVQASTGLIQWTYQTGNSVDASPAIGADDTVYVGSYDNNMYALDGSTGALKWKTALEGNIPSGAAIGADGTIYCLTFNGYFDALDGHSGIEKSSLNTKIQPLLGNLAIAPDGTVYFATSDFNGANSLYAISANETYSVANVYFAGPGLVGEQSTRAVVQVSRPAGDSGLAVALSSSSPDLHVPSQVMIPAGKAGVSFAVSSGAASSQETVTMTAQIGTSAMQASITIYPNQVSKIYAVPNSLAGGENATLVVQLAGPAGASGNQVSVTENQSPLKTVTVPAGKTGVSFAVSTPVVSNYLDPTTTLAFTVTDGLLTKSTNVTLTPYPAKAFYCSPSEVVGGVTTYGVIQLQGPAGGPDNQTPVGSSSKDAQPEADGAIGVPAGKSATSFTITTSPVTSSEVVVLTLYYGSQTMTTDLILDPGLTGVTVSPSTVVGGQSTTGTVQLAGNVGGGGQVVRLSSGSGDVTVPATVTVVAGTSSVSFPITTRKVGANTPVTVRATLGSTGLNTTVTLTP